MRTAARSSRWVVTAMLLFGSLGGAGLPEGRWPAAGAQEPQRDPTVPPPDLLEKLDPPTPSQPDGPAVAMQPRQVTAPAVPTLQVKAIVLSPSKTGHALVSFGEGAFFLELDPKLYRLPVSLPAPQLGPLAHSDGGVQDLAADPGPLPAPLANGALPPPTAAAGSKLANPQLVQAEGALLELVSFFDEVLVFRHLPTQRILFAR